jgi:ATP-dependent helicase/nuclease subunit A
LDQEAAEGAHARLARTIADEIEGLITRREAVFDKDLRCWRPAHAGDVLILVKRRRALFEEILRALKRRGLPVAGADRLSLSEHILFDDLTALARFIQFPDDDLTLAALLKSPLCALNEDSLFDLAHGREGSLWQALQSRVDEQAVWRAAQALLARALDEGRLLRPFDFYSRLLGWMDETGCSVRGRILHRLGQEAQDVIDEFLAQVLNAERNGVADLERLTAAFADLDIVVKREMDGARDEVRVMTVHGAKGLEAPIVIMPETTLTRAARGSALLAAEDGGFLWAPTAALDCDASRAAREGRARREEEEAQRLLYVALTRARDRLILCGRINPRAKEENIGGWYAAAQAAFDHPLVAPNVRLVQRNGMEVRRFGPDPAIAPERTVTPRPDIVLPDWARRPAKPEFVQRFASPSRLGERSFDAGPAASPLARSSGLGRFRRGDLIHRLLQLLPDVATAERPSAAARLLAREPGLTDKQRDEIAAAALGVLSDERFSAVFGPGSRAEAAIAGRAPGLGPTGAIAGRVDRLLIENDRVLLVDFKTNRPSPDRIEDADPAYLSQMAIYGAVLQSIFPDRRIEAALVWTDGPKLMAVPENLRATVLAGLAGAVDS